MDALIHLTISLIIFGVIWWLVDLLPLPSPIAEIVRILFVVMFIMIILAAVGILPERFMPRLTM